MSTVLLGNPAPMMQVKRTSIGDDGEPIIQQVGVPAAHLNQSVTRVEMRDGFDDEDAVAHSLSTDNDRLLTLIGRQLDADHKKYAVGVLEIEQLWGVHCSGSQRPAWVTCEDDAEFAAALAEHFGCPVGEPTALLTNAGRDALHAQHLTTSTQPAAFIYLAVSANTTTPSAASTTLPGEITTPSGGLLRAAGTYAHTTGTNTSTLTKTFTANGSDSLPVVLAKIGVLNASSVGTLGYETLLNATATLTVSGDSAAVTWTDTVG